VDYFFSEIIADSLLKISCFVMEKIFLCHFVPIKMFGLLFVAIRAKHNLYELEQFHYQGAGSSSRGSADGV
jgi:hypothetical protein